MKHFSSETRASPSGNVILCSLSCEQDIWSYIQSTGFRFFTFLFGKIAILLKFTWSISCCPLIKDSVPINLLHHEHSCSIFMVEQVNSIQQRWLMRCNHLARTVDRPAQDYLLLPPSSLAQLRLEDMTQEAWLRQRINSQWFKGGTRTILYRYQIPRHLELVVAWEAYKTTLSWFRLCFS